MLNTIIEGVFDGEGMIGTDGKTYLVSANYASKSKILEGDELKLTIQSDGEFVYKQIKPVQRRRLRGVITFDEGNKKYRVRVDDKFYNVLYASISYFKAEEGDTALVEIPIHGEPKWVAIENVIKVQGTYIDPTEEEF